MKNINIHSISCCEASDSDNGKNYLVKGTTNGTVFERVSSIAKVRQTIV